MYSQLRHFQSTLVETYRVPLREHALSFQDRNPLSAFSRVHAVLSVYARMRAAAQGEK